MKLSESILMETEEKNFRERVRVRKERINEREANLNTDHFLSIGPGVKSFFQKNYTRSKTNSFNYTRSKTNSFNNFFKDNYKEI